MNDKLISYSIISVNNENNMDYLSNFTPFVKDILKSSPEDIIRKDYVQNKLKEVYSLDIPSGVIGRLFDRLAKDNYILTERIDSNSYIYKPNHKMLETSEFKSKKINFEKNYNDLISEYIKFCKESHNLIKTESEAEKDIFNIIGEKKIDILMNELGKSSTNRTDEEESNSYLIGTFVKFLNETDSFLYYYLVDIVKGSMLMNVVYFNEKSNVKMKFKNTSIYLDTSFIMYALGLSGPERKAPCSELLELLKKNGAMIKCFSDNVDEIRGILGWTKSNLYQGNDKHDTIQYFLEHDFTDSDIEMLIYNIEEKIVEIGIEIEDITYNENEFQYNIDENQLNQFLEKSIYYSRAKARETDVRTISAIIRKRKGKKYLHIEECKALMVTTNRGLVKNTREFFSDEVSRQIDPIMLENSVLNLVWIKNPNLSVDLPNKILMANCFAAISPSDRFWNKYLGEINRLSSEGRTITEEDVVTLRYTKLAKDILMENTLGKEEKIDSGTVEYILSQIEIKKAEERKGIESKKNKEIEVLQQQVYQLKENDNKNTIIKNSNRRKVIHWLFLAITYSLGGLFAFFMYYLLKLNSVNTVFSVIISIIFSVVVPTLDFLDLFNFKDCLRFFENKVQKRFELDIPNKDILDADSNSVKLE